MKELLALPCWLPYKLEPQPDGRTRKPPHSPITGKKFSTWNQPGQQVTYGEALDAVDTHNLSGIGFVIPPNFAAIDLDKCKDDPRAFDIIHILDSYTELTPSGNGYHAIVKVDPDAIPKEGRAQKFTSPNGLQIELYVGGQESRYLTFTDQPLEMGMTIQERTTEILNFLQKHGGLKGKTEKPPTPASNEAVPLNSESFSDDAYLLSIARNAKNGNKFVALFDKGDTSEYKDDPSNADIALCGMLAFYTKKDPERIDRLFRQSALYREEKWGNRQDYRERTINTAITNCKGSYKPRTKRKTTPITPKLIPSDLTDVGEAVILAREYGNRFRYSGATGYLVYNGKVWEDIQEKRYAVMQRLTTRQLKEAEAMIKAAGEKVSEAKSKGRATNPDGSLDKENFVKDADNLELQVAKREYAEAMEYYKFVLQCRSNGKSNGVLSQIQPHILIAIDDLDANPFYLNTPAGTINLQTGEIKKHSPTDYCTKITAVSPSTKGADIFNSALDVITQNDSDLANYIQDYAGMAAVGKVYGEYLGIAYGEGANGKSTLFNSLARVLGDYAGTISAETLMTNDKGSKNWDYAELRGKRLIIAAELEEGKRLSTKALKIIASTDRIHAEKKYKDPFKFIPSHSAILYTNHLPRVGSSDDGTWRRLITIPFNAKITGDSDIKNFSDYLFEHAGEAILQWIIEGAKRFIANGFKINHPPSVVAAIEEYRNANDWITSFVDECCDLGKDFTERSSNMLEQYKRHCELTSDHKRHDKDFKSALIKRGHECKKLSIGMVYYGIRLKPKLKVGKTH